MSRREKIRLGIIFGGRSGEHEVSIASAASVIGALDPEEFEISVIGITRTGAIAEASEVRRMLPKHLWNRFLAQAVLDGGASGIQVTSPDAGSGSSRRPRPEIIFPLLHGPYGEDGTVQGLLEMAGVPYVGCGVLASAAGMDKDLMKRLFLQEGLPVLPFVAVQSKELRKRLPSLRRLVEKELGYPMFSKPANLGSSVGVCKIHNSGEFEHSLEVSSQYDSKILIEKGIQARELECAVLGNEKPAASVVGEVIPSNEFYDYDAKYRNPSSRLEIPARISDKQSKSIRDMAVRAFRTIEGSGLSRVDFFAEKKTGKIWLSEINTMPGFTPISMYAKLWAASGVGFQELVRSLVRLGLEKHRERQSLRIFAAE